MRAIMILLVLCGCAIEETGTLQGTVSIGPLCPVETDPPQPVCMATSETYAAWPLVVSQGVRLMATITPDDSGYFMMELPAGRYTINLERQTMYQGNLPMDIIVNPGEKTTVSIDIDTGIR